METTASGLERVIAGESEICYIDGYQGVLSEELGRRTGHEKLFKLSRRMEETVKSIKGLVPNVDFYSASAYYSLGIPIDLYTPIFAVSRMAGWTAHVLEQYRNNRLIRPRAEYKGNPDGQTWIPVVER